MAQEAMVMGDELSDENSPDSSRVDVDEPWERRYWSRFFGVTEVELRQAVAVVGSQAEALRKHFRASSRDAR